MPNLTSTNDRKIAIETIAPGLGFIIFFERFDIIISVSRQLF